MPVENFKNSQGLVNKLLRRFHSESRMIYRAPGLDSLFKKNYELLEKFIQHHQEKQAPRIQELIDYAEGANHTILEGEQRRKEEDMSDVRAVHNFGKVISNFKRGYLVGIPIQVEYMDEEEDSEVDQVLDKIAKENDFYNLNRSLVLDMSRTGRAFEIQYFNKNEKLVVKRLDPTCTFAIYENNLDSEQICGIYYYSPDPFNQDDLYIDVYAANKVYHLVRDKEGIHKLEDDPDNDFKAEQIHGFEFPQITEHKNNDAGMGDYESELSLFDLYDAAQSDTANYMADLADAILALFGDMTFPDDVDTAEKQIEYMKTMRKARFMHLSPPKNAEGEESGNVDAKYLYKQYDVAGTEAYKSRLEKNIHEFTSTPDMNDEKFSGNNSGEAMKYKLIGLDQERVSTQALFEKGLRQRYRLISNIYPKIDTENGGVFSDFDIAKLKITFTPNLPKSDSEIVKLIKEIYPMISDETAFKLLEKVTGVKPSEEKRRLADEEPDTFEPRLPVRTEDNNAEEITETDEAREILEGQE
ncbi:phage portal protein [Marinilactibacillus sp. 15R]|uniref:phage portal protein n=1 Tax=Marinilactibacillus sp. 15R TaxID=1911586 RepID=UPI00090C61F3|nr:phage portal protein [Marinilactibacillus sp. 15R]API89040.1 phage portal protein [Marinilactibacillus sp. 15R]